MYRNADIPYWRLSGFYFVYFAFLGGWVPFWNLYLERELDFSAEQIGFISSLVLGTKIVGPYLWGWVADHFGKRVEIIRWGSFLAFISFLGVFWRSDFFWICTVIAVYSFFWNAVLSQFEVVTLSHLKEHSHRYTQIRVWGSIGFIVAVFGLGWVLDIAGSAFLPCFFAVFLASIWIFSLLVKDSQAVVELQGIHIAQSSFRQFYSLVKQPQLLLFFFICFLMQFSHGPYYTFYTIYLEQLGYQRGVIGFLWSLGVVAEVIIFIYMPRLFARYTLPVLLLITLAITALRWFLIAVFAGYFPILLFAQLMHAASFGSFHAIGVETVRRYFGPSILGQGQAFYSAISFGAGGAIGALVSGILWQEGASVIFAVASFSVLIALCIQILIVLEQVNAQKEGGVSK